MFNKKQKSLLSQLLLAVIVVCIYSVSINYKIFNAWDDQTYILNNPRLALNYSNVVWYFKNSYFGNYIPLTMFSYMFDYNIWGLNGFFYHFQNIFWHILTTLALFNIFRKFNISILISFLICLIFSCHPQRVESVVWISERKDVLCAAFYFWSIYFYINSKRKTSFILFICAMLSKPMAISLPLILFLYEYYTVNGKKSLLACPAFGTGTANIKLISHPAKVSKNRSLQFIIYLKKLYPFLIIMILFVPIIFLSQGSAVNVNVSLWEKLLIVIHNILWYVQQTLIPQNLNPIYPPFYYFDSITVLICSSIFILLLLLVLFLKFKEKFLFIFLCYLIALAPVSGLVKLGFIDRADRYSYIPSAFIWFGIALLIMSFISSKSARNKKYIAMALFFIVLVYGYINIEYQKNWENLGILMEKACSYSNPSPLALRMLADDKLEKDDYKSAYFISEKCIHLKNKFPNNSFAIYNYVGGCFIKMKIEFVHNRIQNTLVYFNSIKKIIKESDPWHKDYLLIGASCYNRVGNIRESVILMDEVVRLKKISEFGKLFYWGIREYYAQNYKEALSSFKDASKIQPKDKNLLSNIKNIKRLLSIKSLN